MRLSCAMALAQCGGATAKRTEIDPASGAATSTGGVTSSNTGGTPSSAAGGAPSSAAGGTTSSVAGSGATGNSPGGSAGSPIIDDPTLELPAFCHDEVVSDSVYCQGDGPPRPWVVYDAETESCLAVEVNRCLTMAFGSMAMCEVYCVTRASSQNCPKESIGLRGESCDMEGSACVYGMGGCLCTTLSGESCGELDPACAVDPIGRDSGSNEPTICECRDGSWMCYLYGSFAF